VPQNPEFEAQIARTDDVAAYEVYADWLAERGDPRGELTMLALAVERDGLQRAKAEAVQAAMLLHEHAPAWLGSFTRPHVHYALEWHRGWITTAALGSTTWDDAMPEPDELSALYAQLRALPAASLLRTLDFREFGDDDYEPRWDGCLEMLAEHGVPESLWRLRLGRTGYWDISATSLDDLAPVCTLIPQLRELALELGHVNLGPLDLPELRSFELRTGGFTKQNLAAVLAAGWPKLERLALCFGENNYGGDCTAGDVARLLEHAPPQLVHLGLANAAFTDELVPLLAKRPLLRQLRTLDLPLGTFTDDGAALIVQHADAFGHLARLDISETCVTTAGVGALRRVVREVVDREMKAPDDRYCAIGE
jgi:uncharacterized protein (TIGR02996 family)